jgi:hypothetical protein
MANGSLSAAKAINGSAARGLGQEIEVLQRPLHQPDVQLAARQREFSRERGQIMQGLSLSSTTRWLRRLTSGFDCHGTSN